ncbi:sigma-70 family RNA polymerase sigma factor [Aureliella helgolandensis]|uniref:ECF RNA polymerase sigma-E factor n=1 Tax=Aureliella helgolandensis TaxID=2527968 RepID=A0A518G9J7_9BACT|nr:sigma-70 family RNA polymerase sigma factor [Aureliella helgolandensis]QDV25265.1 ECF RNA polymerase sigma-E factor [Aureliella helgolandensis]
MPTINSTEDGPLQERTQWLMRYEAWLRILARCEIDSRFAGKFDASDAVQNTLIEAWKGWDQFRGSEEPQRLAWLRQILAYQLAHLARQYAGTQMRDVTRETTLEQSLGESSNRLDCLLVAQELSPSQQAMANERSIRLAAALEMLPADYRDVIRLRHIENLSHEEVAVRMNRNSGAVRMLWMRALAALRGVMISGDPL